VTDDSPGTRREGAGAGFRDVRVEGRAVRDAATLRGIKALVSPPAWNDVWICPDPRGHIQATGRDACGRKRYKYHPVWREMRDQVKNRRLSEFGRALKRIRARTERDLRLAGLPRRKVLATVVRLLETTFIRVGNAEYTRQNGSFGLTTLRDRHATIDGAKVRFRFRGKRGIGHAVDLQDLRLARIVRRCQELPGQEWFQDVDPEENFRDVDSADVNESLREISGGEFTAKDFRTWAGTILAALAPQEIEACDSPTQAKKNTVRAVRTLAARLGNTPSICRKCYIHPAVLESYLDGTMIEALKRRTDAELDESLTHWHPEEAAVLALLKRRLAREAGELAHAE
jgi:DNA topoisomerase-1